MTEQRHYCGGYLRPRTVVVEIGERDRRWISVFVPGGVCDTCGREQFSASAAEKLEEVLAGGDYGAFVYTTRSETTSAPTSSVSTQIQPMLTATTAA